ncbi:gamma-glutamyltransferase [Catenovulum sp. 2E275]|uniref:gamma-glutamyltransferase family protein n=1 Tax=Catenovulum sp. 2E275 TaxID=2980497 RepID=UPI0021D2E62A|nr:gamma-glutamyltransferase [Catenovulum sp. 2E275]MCU4677412.1 gamma-glutamyltransferase [Catenovulum sp. 2E275]
MAAKQDIAFTAPHWAATEAGIEILEAGGSAVEAMVAAAAVIAVVYPHMNSIAGDGFWIIDNAGSDKPVAIDACGRSAANIDAFLKLPEIPARGGQAALTQAGTISGWQAALKQDKSASLPLSQILARAIDWAQNGFEVSNSLYHAALKLSKVPERNQAFKALYESRGNILQPKQTFKNPKLAETFQYLAKHGLNAFYQGELAQSFAEDLQAAGSPLTAKDLANTQANLVEPLIAQLEHHQLFNLPAPTQGIHSLQILAIVDKLKAQLNNEADWLHAIVEASKQSFNLRDQIWADPNQLNQTYFNALSDRLITKLSQNIDLAQAKNWPFNADPGDTIWMGAKDKNGQMVSFIQSIYWEFGSGVAMRDGGFVWNNRGVSFSLDKTHINYLAPNKKPAHTLNPAFAKFSDGRRMVYGTMGGEGQPQTQATIFSRYAWRNFELADAIAKDRWLLGRTWGDTSTNLKVEAHLAAEIADELNLRNHDWQKVATNNEMMGHAGAIVAFEHAENSIAATDPRSDGLAIVR